MFVFQQIFTPFNTFHTTLKINPKDVYPMELILKVELHIPECRPK